MVNTHAALIYTMVLVSAVDRSMSDPEMQTIGDLVRRLPIFEDFDFERLPEVAADCARRLGSEENLDSVLQVIQDAIPERLAETAYALAIEVAAADGSINQEELRILELLRHKLEIDRLNAAAIERGARARFARM